MRTHLAIAVVIGLAGGCLSVDKAAHPVDASQLDARWIRAAPTPAVVQHGDSDCGAAALAMVAGAWGRHWSLDAIEDHLRISGDGIELGKLRDFARSAGLDAYVITGTRDDLVHELRAGRPVVLGLVLPVDREHNRNHYEVAVALDPRSGEVVTIDPATGKMQARKPAVLDLEWKTAGYATLVIVGDRRVAAKESPR